MAYKLTVTQKPTHLHFVITGQNGKDTILEYVEEINQECSVRKCFRVLIEEHLDGPRLSIMDLFEIIQNVTSRTSGLYKAIAYVDVNAVGDTMKFAEDACVNRALPIVIFPTVSEAEKWLQGKK